MPAQLSLQYKALMIYRIRTTPKIACRGDVESAHRARKFSARAERTRLISLHVESLYGVGLNVFDNFVNIVSIACARRYAACKVIICSVLINYWRLK